MADLYSHQAGIRACGGLHELRLYVIREEGEIKGAVGAHVETRSVRGILVRLVQGAEALGFVAVDPTERSQLALEAAADAKLHKADDHAWARTWFLRERKATDATTTTAEMNGDVSL
jgi:alpha-D-ribose 1-methylphosphonate 5-triphosphate synthase subunit PhnG